LKEEQVLGWDAFRYPTEKFVLENRSRERSKFQLQSLLGRQVTAGIFSYKIIFVSYFKM
jgi:hypothetical protein